MNAQPKTDHLTQWQRGMVSPNPAGRPQKFITSLKKQGYTQSQVNDIILVMLTLDETELSDIVNTGKATILELTIARALLNGAKKGSLYAIESLLNRAIGLPRVTQEVNIEAKHIILTMDLG